MRSFWMGGGTNPISGVRRGMRGRLTSVREGLPPLELSEGAWTCGRLDLGLLGPELREDELLLL